ncbi:hypothetical protein [Enterococcus hermanniensis]|uniref:DUF3784 domain-containing protein n=1 Tax=Enterococcus hermanniensis TaxID=249189 RepID=A0A1L8TS35_9ENTE|nr:hypothetical protein [Enterococcus hermanniensis]OJG47141.1 hypothetical protein RV04_GL000388 [Enterococcus hermanniensis]
MVRILLFLLALIVLFCSYYLIKKPTGFLVLFSQDEQEDARSFLKQFGYLYALLGTIGIVIGVIDHRAYSMMYLVALLVIAAIFALMMGAKTKKG